MTHRPWSREQIEALLARENFKYQKIDLPHGLSTGGKERATPFDRIFPSDLRGKTVLDLGCNHGYFCFEAIRRGASRVVGYDISNAVIRKARLLAEAMGSTVEFEVRDLNRQPLTESFDYILCLNLLHHLDNPLLLLDGMMTLSRQRLVLEIAGVSLFDHFHKWQGLTYLAFLLSPLPVMVIGRQKRKNAEGKPETLKFYFTKQAMRRLFARHSPSFATVDIKGSNFKGRFLVVAQRTQPA